MAILFSQADGSDQHYDTYEEFEKAFILLKRLNGEKVPQDLLDEVSAKNDELNGVELEDSPTEFRTGDLVRVTESFRDIFGDVAKTDSVLTVLTDENNEVVGVGSVLIGDNLDKLRLVCLREDRKDIEL